MTDNNESREDAEGERGRSGERRSSGLEEDRISGSRCSQEHSESRQSATYVLSLVTARSSVLNMFSRISVTPNLIDRAMDVSSAYLSPI